MSKKKLVYVEWEDAYNFGAEWFSNEEIDEKLGTSFIVQEVGWILREDAKSIIMASKYAVETEHHAGITKIPKPWIRNRRTLS